MVCRPVHATQGNGVSRSAFHFNRYATIDAVKATEIAEGLWQNINLKNLRQNIVPTRPRADLILRKGEKHFIETVALRKL